VKSRIDKLESLQREINDMYRQMHEFDIVIKKKIQKQYRLKNDIGRIRKLKTERHYTK
jgi:hypothetical protein